MEIEQLGPYHIEGVLGQGGVATVYRALHQPLRRYVALKVLDASLSRNPEFVKRFEQEATLAAQLEHPNIIQVYDLGVADGHQYIAMRLIEGSTLEAVIRDQGPMSAQRALGICAEVADALSYAHAQGVLHRDVKPSNILLWPNGRPVLTDFGIARAAESLGLTRAHSVVGTPRYMSPEQVMAQPTDARSDIYSLGIVLYEMLTGKVPFSATSTPSLMYMHVHEPPRPLTQERPDLFPGVRELVDRCLAKSPDDRYRSAAEVAAICRALSGMPGLDASNATISDATMLIPPPSPGSATRTSTPPPWTPSPGRVASPTPTGAGASTPSNVSWPPAGTPTGPPTSAGPHAAAMTPAPAERQQAGWRRGPITIPVLVGALVALLALGGGILVGSDRFGGRSASPTAETKQPTSQPAATAVPAVAASPAAAAKASPAATSAPSPTAARAVAAASPVPAAASPVAAGVAPAGDAAGRFLSDSMAALGRRDWSAALEQANAGLKVDPANPGLAKAAVQARLGLAEQLWSRGAGKEALPHFLAVREQPLRGAASTAELREADLSAPYIWGDLMASVDPPTAIFEYDKVFRRDPNFKDIRKKFYDLNVTLAKQFIGRGDREGAARYVNGARRANPDAPEVNDLTKSLTPTPS